ncbi:MAG: undecaprenyl-phosphate galactose phosphotransferase WbaP [Alphaproteobacteria bacterium]|nr:undecaprenyl-phosphate galactose phosphotransferase WbaP [Alphaproteobacteria bacterium]
MIDFGATKSRRNSADKIAAPQHLREQAANTAASQQFPDFQSRLRVSGRWMLAVDLLALAFAYIDGALVALVVRSLSGESGFQDILGEMTLRQFAEFWALGLTAILWLDSRGHYRQRLPYWESIGHIVSVAAVGFVASGFIEFASHNTSSRLWMGSSWILFAVFALLGRSAARHRLEKRGAWRIPAVIIGEGPTAQATLRALSRDKFVGFTIVDQIPSSVLSDMKKTRAWKQILMLHDAHYIFLALEGGEMERYQSALKSLPRARVPCSIIPPWLGLPSSTLTPHNFMMQDVMMLHDTNRLKLPLPRMLKRLVDIVLAGTALTFLLPVFVVTAGMVRRDGGEAFFKQARIGRNGKLFQCYKFRSMRADAEEYLARYLAENKGAAEEWAKFQKLKEDVRVTRFGAFIRRTSIDELPQLINVLKGDMSLVGPRPCMPGQEGLYAEDFSFYESVRPGITGPWQVSGRNHLTFKERVALEAWYARNWSLWLDIVIILKTFPILLKRDQAF